MRALADGYRGMGVVLQLNADRIFAPLAIMVSLIAATALAYQFLQSAPLPTPGFY